MANIVGDTLASSKLAMAQDNLHLAGSSVDQLTVQFNQLAFDEFLAFDRSSPNKRRRSEDRQPTTRAITPPSSTGSVPSPDHGPVRATAQPLTYQPAIESGIPWGSLNPRRQEPRRSTRRPEPLTR